MKELRINSLRKNKIDTKNIGLFLKNKTKRNQKTKNISDNGIKFAKVAVIIVLFFLIVLIFKSSNCFTKYVKRNIYDNILPRISLKNKAIPSLNEIFNSRILYINDSYLTEDYIRYVRPINEKEELKYNRRYSEKETFVTNDDFKRRKDQYDYNSFAKLCFEEKLIDSNGIKYNNKPIISIVIPSYNKGDILLKSIRSIQNQSFKNFEIIIVNDCSTDNTDEIVNYLLKTDPRIRVFNHLKNMGCWRSRVDGVLYSRGKYIILFDAGDFYEDNYVLEDANNIMEKYNLDSSKFLFRIVRGYNRLEKSFVFFHVRKRSRIVYGPENIYNFNRQIFSFWGNIWNRLTRADIFIKGLYLLNDYVLNYYKNVWDDVWWNTIINKVSHSYLIYERVGYVYSQDGKGAGSPKARTIIQKDKIIKEYLGFLYFNYCMLPKNDNKKGIIDKLKKYDQKKGKLQLSFLRTKFEILYNLINMLIKDPYISDEDKVFLNKILNEAKEREIKIKSENLN